ncbi:Pyridoxal 5'-phosphate synthase subunit snz1 [Coemansia javaensis]|uniref:pyridoxal 5'-phosphate synthase (glutamine hydrolyzing) n=1 Tax=Coemansia javaensis TaxID=2761396 RepID=A0A9W8LJ99_9FUNG|nr:Pyridoxal 5'-phosphate synthase subunit snz1 [Coemansia javaensis]
MSTPDEKAKDKSANFKKKLTFMRGIEGGIVTVVHTVEQAITAERNGARAVIVIGNTATQAMGLGNAEIPRAADPRMVKRIMDHVMLPTFARVSIGHNMEARVMQHSWADGIDENEALAATSDRNIDYHALIIPAIAGVSNLQEALEMIKKGAAALRNKLSDESADRGMASEDTGTIKQAVVTMQGIKEEIKTIGAMSPDERKAHIEGWDVKEKDLERVLEKKRLMVPFFADGGVYHPMDVAMLMSTGYTGAIASVQLFQARNPEKRMRSLVMAAKHHDRPDIIASITEDHGNNGEVV